MTPSRRSFLKAMGTVTAVGLLNACTSNGSGASTSAAAGGDAGAGAGSFPETPEWNFVFVNHVTTNPFFVPTVYGIEDASALLGTTFQWTGSEIADNGEMVNSMEAAIAAGADGIGVALVDLEAFNGPTDDALGQGIPVLSYNADAANSRLCYVGQDLYGSGYEMGLRIVDLVGSGKVALFIATPGQLNSSLASTELSTPSPSPGPTSRLSTLPPGPISPRS
jgi:simple sugar transport system substrate-binding protein